jgi:hypothetical protein
MRERAADLRRIVGGVVAQAVADAAAGGVLVLEDWTPEGELVYEWLVAELGEERVWRAASLASNVHGLDADANLIEAWRAARSRSALLAHPATKTALLLGGAWPRADLFPLGDLYASQVSELAEGWTVPADLAELVAGSGVVALDGALARLVDGREAPDRALAGLDGGAADQLIRLYERGRYFRLRPRLVPKLGARTAGVDLFD